MQETEQPMPTVGGQSVTDALIEHLKARQQKGIETYGRSLETFNGRRALRDAREEALDLAQYIQQAEMEREALDRVAVAVFHHIRSTENNTYWPLVSAMELLLKSGWKPPVE